MDWNKIVKAIGDYHGIECCSIETMEEADAQLAELYAKERHTPQESKPTAKADMDEFGEWLRIMSEKASYSDQRDLLRVVLRHYKESRPVKAPADEGLVTALEIIRSGGTIHLEKYSKLEREDMMKIAEDFLARPKPPANADMVETEFGEWLRIMSEKASYSDQRDLLRVVLRHYKESRPVKADDDGGWVETVLGEGPLEFDGIENSWYVPLVWRSDGMKCCGKEGKLVFRHKASDKGVK